MNLHCWLTLFLVLSVIGARSFYYLGTRNDVRKGQEVDSAASTQVDRALTAAWERRFATKDLQ